MEVNKTNNQANLESELNFAPLDLPKDTNNIISTIVSGVNKHKITPAIEHSQLYEEILKEIKPIDFKAIVFPKLKDYEEQLKGLEVDSPDYKKVKELIKKCKLLQKHYVMVYVVKINETPLSKN